MLPLFKLLIFFIVLAVVVLLGYWSYKKLNDKIIPSETLTALLCYSLILITANMLLFFGGSLLLLSLFRLLSSGLK